MRNGKRFPGIGLRNIKTALAVLICMLIFMLLDHFDGFVPASDAAPVELLHFLLRRSDPIFACVAAVIVMQSTLENSVQLGKSRILGTVVGGVSGLVLLWIDTLLLDRRFNIAIVTLGIVLVIYFCTLVGIQKSVPIAVITFLIIMISLGERNPFGYALNRMIDTGIGIVVSVTVNYTIGNPNRRKRRLAANREEAGQEEQAEQAEASTGYPGGDTGDAER